MIVRKFTRSCLYLLLVFLFATITEAQTGTGVPNDKIQTEKKDAGKNNREAVEVEAGISSEHYRTVLRRGAKLICPLPKNLKAAERFTAFTVERSVSVKPTTK